MAFQQSYGTAAGNASVRPLAVRAQLGYASALPLLQKQPFTEYGMKESSSDAPKKSPALLHEVLGMEILSASEGRATARMKVEEKVCQIFGYLSGGASLALMETLAGYGSLALCGPEEVPLGIQVSANHMHAVPMGGEVTATATLLQHTRHLHVWNVDIHDSEGRLISSGRVTNCIKKTPQ